MEPSELRLAVLGLGHAGLPTALGLAELGWNVVGADNDLVKVNGIARGEPPFSEPGTEEMLRRHLDTGRFVVEADVAAAMRGANVLFLCVGTPQREDGSADLTQLEALSRTIASNLNGYKLIVEKSTAPVQTAKQIRDLILGHSDAGTSAADAQADFDIAVNPEFLREGTALNDFFNPARIVLGVENERAAKLLLKIYRPLLERGGRTVDSSVIVTDVKNAEIIKHASNAFLATKISFINMVADLCEATGANIEEVARCMGMYPRIGPRSMQAGVGYGGYCLPKDIRAFSWVAARHGADFSLLREVERINGGMVDHFVSKVCLALKEVRGKSLAVWGLAYKPGTDDVREAPSLAIIRGLTDEGAHLRLYDPGAMDEFRRHFGEDSPLISYCSSPEEAADGAEALLILTEWGEFLDVDLTMVRQRMATPLIVDGRNMLDPAVVRGLGFEYHSIGRP